jgi:hypothetical protein
MMAPKFKYIVYILNFKNIRGRSYTSLLVSVMSFAPFSDVLYVYDLASRILKI